MSGIVMIESGELCCARRYADKHVRRQRIKEIIMKYNLTNYKITIRPDDNEEDGYDIKHAGSVVLRNTYCDPCVVL